MPRYQVHLSRLVRETANIVVEAASIDDLTAGLRGVYESHEHALEWEEDPEWGAEQGTHTVVGVFRQDDVVAAYVGPQGQVYDFSEMSDEQLKRERKAALLHDEECHRMGYGVPGGLHTDVYWNALYAEMSVRGLR